MIDWYTMYQFFFPSLSRLQQRLRKERAHLDVEVFAHAVEGGDHHPEIAHALWDLLRARAFVRDFRPHPDDDLYEVFAMDEEIVNDEILNHLLKKMELSLKGVDVSAFPISSITTPKKVMEVLVFAAEARNADRGRNNPVSKS